jgi:4-aminobutyrate aminotransferase
MGYHDELLARHRQVLPSWLSLFYEHPITLVSGQGCRVTDGEGRTYLDGFGGILTTMVGHDIPEITEAVAAQAGRIIHSSTLYLIEPMVELAEEIAARSGIPDAKVFFTTSGSEANEAALLLAATHRRSNQVLAVRNSYHGRSFATMGITGNRGWSASSLTPFTVAYLASGYRFRSPFRHLLAGADGDASFVTACLDDLREVVATQTSGDIACLIAEPIQGVGGFAVPPDGMLGAYQQTLAEVAGPGTVVISDEVQTGWGRTGEHFWGYTAAGLQPDLLTFAKGVGNGVPLAGVVGRAEIMDGIGVNSISTFGGGPLVAATGLATLRYVLDHDLQANAARTGARLRELVDPLADRFTAVGEVRGKGLMVGLEIVADDGFAPDPGRATAVLERTRELGLLVGKGGLHGNCLRIAPPMTITADEIDEAGAIVAKACEEVLG